MAHKVACYRKKCIKSANCFRDREELSSLYTISSHSASSMRSNETTTSHNNDEKKMLIKEETYSGDSCRNSPYESCNDPPSCTCNMRNGVHQNTCSHYRHRNYCNKKTPHIKDKIENLPYDACEYVRQCCAKTCPVHQYNKPKYCTNIKNLEECYWAKWKPSKFECTQRRRGCCECDCPKLRTARTQDKSVEVLREPGAFENASSNENATINPTQHHHNTTINATQHHRNATINPTQHHRNATQHHRNATSTQPSTKDLYKNVLKEYNNQFSDPQISYRPTNSDENREETKRTSTPHSESPHSEHSVRFLGEDRVHEFDPGTAYNADLYDEIYEEYENEFMRKIEEDEQRRKAEYYQELYDNMYNEYENELLSRIPSDQTETTETMPESTPEETERTADTDNMEDKSDSITVLHKSGNLEDNVSKEEPAEPEATTPNAKDLKAVNTESFIAGTKRQEDQGNVSQQKITKPTAEHLPVKGHTYPLKSMAKKQAQDKSKSKNGINRTGSPGSMNYLPAYLQRRVVTNK